ncbi:MAG: pectin esterase [Fibrobacteraceae bacterium]|nr:pectin esterase [Fibrobacteraceae bacterium]
MYFFRVFGFYKKGMFGMELSRYFFVLTLASAVNVFAVTKKTFDFVVGFDGDFKAALAAASAKPGTEDSPFVIFFPNGNYNIGALTGDTNQMTTMGHSNISLIGESADNVKIYNTAKSEAISTTATIKTTGKNVYMQDLMLENRASVNPNAKANRFVVIMQTGDKYIYKNVKQISGQDTYYTNSSGRTYYEGGHIEGTVDFICGSGEVFFQNVHLSVTRSGGVITAPKSSTWGYVFNEPTIDGTNGAAGTYMLGRSWNARAKSIFINAQMNAQPTAAGWGDPMNDVPERFAEYNSKNGSGGTINLSQRRTQYYSSKSGKTATINPVLSASEAAKYTVENVLGGTDNWRPAEIAKQVAAPKISQAGPMITWEDNANARAYAIFKNGKYFDNVATNSYMVSKLTVGDKITVRSANSRGGLGDPSNEITVASADPADMVEVKITQNFGGTLSASPNGNSLPKGYPVTFTATPLEGWKVEAWGGDAMAAEIPAQAGAIATYKIAELTKAAEVSATFMPIDPLKYEAESGTLTNAVVEATNAGFSGSAYINFGAGDPSICEVPIYLAQSGIYNMTIKYANGSGKARSLNIKVGTTQKGLIFEATSAWNEYVAKDVEVVLPKGYSTIIFETVGGNDGPNIDAISLTAVKLDSQDPTTFFTQKERPITSYDNATLYTIQGKKLRHGSAESITKNLPQGIYMVKTQDTFKVIQVR